MENYNKALSIMNDLFGKDCFFMLATASDNAPSMRVIDAYYENEAFWIVTYAQTTKVQELTANPKAALAHEFYHFKGNACNMGHPLKEENREIRETLTRVFAPWYFAHNNEDDEQMCFVKFIPETGFVNQGKIGYHINFVDKTVRETPFTKGPDTDE